MVISTTFGECSLWTSVLILVYNNAVFYKGKEQGRVTLSLGFSKQLYTSEGGSTQNVGNDDFHYNNPLKLTTLHCITTFHMDTID